MTYRWAEQYLMVRKARLFGDGDSLAAIFAARTPAECKALGRRVTPHDELWARERHGAALDMLRLKFGQNAGLRRVLLETGDALLAEASPTDRIRGVGFSEREAEAHRHAWGENLLGRALVEVRAELRE